MGIGIRPKLFDVDKCRMPETVKKYIPAKKALWDALQPCGQRNPQVLAEVGCRSRS